MNIEQAKERLKSIVDFYKLNDENNYDYSDEVLISMRLVLEEIERLNKCYCERTDCSGRIKNSKKYESMQEEIERLNNIISSLNHKFKILDDFIEREIDLYTIELTEENKNKLYITAPILGVYKEIHNILNGLKGSDK